MFLNTVVLILQESIEAALIISVLAVISRHLGVGMRWVAGAFALGCLGALLYGDQIGRISNWFDDSGQELVNATLQYGLVVSMMAASYLVPQIRYRIPGKRAWLALGLSFVVTLGIVQEGSEIFIYLYGLWQVPNILSNIVLGTIIGVSIGISSAILLYYMLLELGPKNSLRAALGLCMLIAGSMASQATLLLIQANWLPYTPQLWDTSNWLSEQSVGGHLLYALVGYEATPSLLQALAYVMAAVAVGASLWLGRRRARKHLKISGGGRLEG